MNIKHIILGLAATALLASCGGSTSDNNDDSSTTNGSETTSASTSSSSQNEEELKKKLGITPVVDEENRTLTYGLYPQTHVSNADTIAALDALTEKEENGWYLYDGEYYVKSSASPFEEDYKFSDGTTIVNKTEYWFKCELITWNILTSNDGTYSLYSNKLLDVQRYDDGYCKYDVSEIRTWLNDGFLNTAFNLGSSYIQIVDVDNSSDTTDILNSNPNSYRCDNTSDKVYMLSFNDYLNEDYGFPSGRDSTSSRTCKPTDYALANHCEISNGNGSYWTRSPYSGKSTSVWMVQYNGEVLAVNVGLSNNGVRPAITIKL